MEALPDNWADIQSVIISAFELKISWCYCNGHLQKLIMRYLKPL
jgi:hypothetical protein